MYYKFIPAKKTGKNCLQKGLTVQVRFRKTSLSTMLDKIDKKFVPSPPPPQIKDAKMARLGLRRASSLIWGGGGEGGGLLFHFILSKIVVRIIMNKNYYGFNKAKAY